MIKLLSIALLVVLCLAASTEAQRPSCPVSIGLPIALVFTSAPFYWRYVQYGPSSVQIAPSPLLAFGPSIPMNFSIWDSYGVSHQGDCPPKVMQATTKCFISSCAWDLSINFNTTLSELGLLPIEKCSPFEAPLVLHEERLINEAPGREEQVPVGNDTLVCSLHVNTDIKLQDTQNRTLPILVVFILAVELIVGFIYTEVNKRLNTTQHTLEEALPIRSEGTDKSESLAVINPPPRPFRKTMPKRLTQSSQRFKYSFRQQKRSPTGKTTKSRKSASAADGSTVPPQDPVGEKMNDMKSERTQFETDANQPPFAEPMDELPGECPYCSTKLEFEDLHAHVEHCAMLRARKPYPKVYIKTNFHKAHMSQNERRRAEARNMCTTIRGLMGKPWDQHKWSQTNHFH